MLLVHLFVLVLFIIANTSVWEESVLLYASRDLFVLVLFIIAITSVWEESVLLYASRAFVCFSPVYHCKHLGLGRERWSVCFSCICLF